MPIYEYRCPEGHTFELFQRITDPPPDACEVCGAAPVSKVLYPAAIHFKGSGFYSTDYGRGGRKRDGKEDGAPGDSKGETKPETKSEKKPAEA
jgi:putative FmdB family regulatory protein